MLRWALRGLSAGSDALGKHHRSSGLPGTGLRQHKSMARWDRQGVSCRGSVPASRDTATPGIQHLSQQPGTQDNEQTCQQSSPAVQGTHVRALVPTAAPRRRNFKRCPLSPGKSGAELQLTLERNAAKAKRTTTSGRCWCYSSAPFLHSHQIQPYCFCDRDTDCHLSQLLLLLQQHVLLERLWIETETREINLVLLITIFKHRACPHCFNLAL